MLLPGPSALLLQAVIRATLLPFVIALPAPPRLAPVPEEVPVLDNVRSKFHHLPASDLYPANPWVASSTFTSAPVPPIFQKPERVSTISFVRGQNGKLVPFEAKPFFIPSDAVARARASGIRSESAQNPWSSITFPWSRQADFRIKTLTGASKQPIAFDRMATPATDTLGQRFNAVQLRGDALDSEILERTQAKGKSFFVQSEKGKGNLYFFDTKDGGKSWTYTDKIARADKDMVREMIAPEAARNGGRAAPTAVKAQSSTTTGGAARRLTRQNARRIEVPWYAKITQRLRSALGKEADFTKYIHSMR